MKRIATVLSLLLACVPFSAANTITLTSGFGQMSGTTTSFNPPPSYSFLLFGSGVGFATGSPSDFPFTSGIQNCVECDPRGLVPILADSGIGENSAGQFYNGLIEFSAVSFVSTLARNGMLTVTYKAFANLDFALCTDQSCQTTSELLVWDPSKLWLVTAQFAPDPNGPGSYDFLNASFQAPIVPEPSSMLLVGSGIVVLIGKIRKTRKD
jgi:PEP-CTERM motif